VALCCDMAAEMGCFWSAAILTVTYLWKRVEDSAA
jgi:hypothetical protein